MPEHESFLTPEEVQAQWLEAYEVLRESDSDAATEYLKDLLSGTWEQAEENKELGKLAVHDELTGFGNRRYLLGNGETSHPGELTIAANHAARTGERLSIFLVDLKDLAGWNKVSHDDGDWALRTLAKAWKEQARPYDRATRMGGDEFVFLVPDADPEMVLERFETQLAENTKVIKGQERRLSIYSKVIPYTPDPEAYPSAVEKEVRTIFDREWASWDKTAGKKA